MMMSSRHQQGIVMFWLLIGRFLRRTVGVSPVCSFQNTTEKHPGFQNLRTPFSHFITWVKKVRGVFNINAILSLNFEISRRLSSHLLSTLLHFRKENSVAFWT